jgi:hypothetical protein
VNKEAHQLKNAHKREQSAMDVESMDVGLTSTALQAVENGVTQAVNSMTQDAQAIKTAIQEVPAHNTLKPQMAAEPVDESKYIIFSCIFNLYVTIFYTNFSLPLTFSHLLHPDEKIVVDTIKLIVFEISY